MGGLLLAIYAMGGNRSLFLELHELAGISATFWASVTILGDSAVTVVLVLPFIRRRRNLVFALIVAGCVACVFTHTLKPWLGVARPPKVYGAQALHVIGPALRGKAFPSGHALTAFTVAGVVAMAIGRVWAYASCISLAGLIALSRVVVGVHWPADILGGAILGWFSAWVGTLAASTYRWGASRQAAAAWGAMLVSCALVLVCANHTGYPQALVFQRVLGVTFLCWGGVEYVLLLRELSTGAPTEVETVWRAAA